MTMEVDGTRQKGHLRKIWWDSVKEDMESGDDPRGCTVYELLQKENKGATG